MLGVEDGEDEEDGGGGEDGVGGGGGGEEGLMTAGKRAEKKIQAKKGISLKKTFFFLNFVFIKPTFNHPFPPSPQLLTTSCNLPNLQPGPHWTEPSNRQPITMRQSGSCSTT